MTIVNGSGSFVAAVSYVMSIKFPPQSTAHSFCCTPRNQSMGKPVNSSLPSVVRKRPSVGSKPLAKRQRCDWCWAQLAHTYLRNINITSQSDCVICRFTSVLFHDQLGHSWMYTSHFRKYKEDHHVVPLRHCGSAFWLRLIPVQPRSRQWT